jgi:uncharacterized damage-inducible protein DinB
MLGMLRDLVQHKAWASAALLSAIRDNETAAADENLRALLHHIILANRFWLMSCLSNQAFDIDAESRAQESLDAIADQYRSTQMQEWEWIAHAMEPDLARVLDDPLIPGGSCSVAQAYMQVCLHSHGHRAQCAKLLRSLGGTPPATDFILWLKDRPAPNW